MRQYAQTAPGSGMPDACPLNTWTDTIPGGRGGGGWVHAAEVSTGGLGDASTPQRHSFSVASVKSWCPAYSALCDFPDGAVVPLQRFWLL